MTDKSGESWLKKFGHLRPHPHGWRYCWSDADRETLLQSLRELVARPDSGVLSGGVIPGGFRPEGLFFDVDATLIREESIVELAREYGCGKEVALVTEKAMQGELDFEEALIRRVGLLQGMPESQIASVSGRLSFQPGLPGLVSWARGLDIPLFMVSGGFTLFVKELATRLKFTDFAANVLEIKNRQLTGKLQAGAPVVDGGFKATWLKKMCRSHGLDQNQVLATGDGANDRFMMGEVGLGAGFMPKATLLPHLHIINRTGSYQFLQDLLVTASGGQGAPVESTDTLM